MTSQTSQTSHAPVAGDGPAPSIGYLGLGAMGGPMAHRLIDAGHALQVWNRTASRTEPFVARGATRAASAAELAASSDVVLSCLLSTDVTRQVYLGPNGIVAAARPGTLIVEHGTFDPALAHEIADAAADRGILFVDAPVSGGAVAAEAGALAVMAGGPAAAEARFREAVAPYARVVEWLGPVGSGLALKLVNQMLVSTHVAVATEAANVVQSLGIDPAAATRVLAGGWAQSAMLERALPLAFAGDFTAPSDATIGGLAEAQRLLREVAAAAGVAVPVFDRAADRFAQARELGWGDRDLAALAGLGAPA
ncbi:NAD(P)-dependent oxidoreductase [Leucobacter chromiireducens]|uniref:NAD(P)-dependent oxidoreductase n=1 Tax=Leucobacter chromiireducens subsp. solipictus TaxID=398235 RepID=A0ABS1SEP2_9MICO|nr:NAD(P)-dependent oxidoreductase [Leucobacter chromiireducens]MBL3679015.1 NAD(P)-dependent oxidoreductase [Leucobacter chromiireducens subsp. solipictus]